MAFDTLEKEQPSSSRYGECSSTALLSDCVMARFRFMDLPPELRLRIYEISFHRKTTSENAHLSPKALYPRPSFSLSVADCIAQDIGAIALYEPLATRDVLVDQYLQRRVFKRCSGCLGRFRTPSSRYYCWRCKDSGHALLLISKTIHDEVISVFYSRITPELFRTKDLMELFYCLRSQNTHVLLRALALRVPVKISLASQSWKQWTSEPDAGVLISAFPNLQRLDLEFFIGMDGLQESVEMTDWREEVSGSAHCLVWPDVVRPRQLHELIEFILPSFQQYPGLTVHVNGLCHDSIKDAIETALRHASLDEYDIAMKAVEKFWTDKTEVD